MIELTVPFETRIDEAYERKMTKYSDLCTQARDNGWKAACYPVEVGTRGFVAKSMIKAMKDVGLTSKERNRAVKYLEKETEKASNWIWLQRSSQTWTHKS